MPSIERYREIEALSGIDFYTECGHLQVVTGECEKLSVVRNAYRNLRLHGKTVQLINRKDKASETEEIDVKALDREAIYTRSTVWDVR